MATKLNKLTPEQEAQIPIIRDEFLRIGLSTEPADFEAAEQAVRDAYAVAGLPTPKMIIRFASPREGAIGAAILKNTRLGESGAQVWARVWAQVWAQVWTAFYSQHEAGWLAWASYFHKICGLRGTEKIEPLARIAANCGWCWFFAGAAIITERPRTLKRDDQNRLHCENGPALEYRDGFAVHAWHGTRLPCEWIENRETIDPTEILRCENVEQRAAGSAAVGWKRMLDVLDAKIIDSDPDPDHGDLIELKLPGLPEPGLFLRAYCKRNGLIVEGVPRISDIDGTRIKTVRAAQAWSFGKAETDFQYPNHVS